MKTDKRVDAYIAKSAGFAKPILGHLRELIHAACPDAEKGGSANVREAQPQPPEGVRRVDHRGETP